MEKIYDNKYSAAMGHSTGGGAAIFLGTHGSFPVSALGLIAPATFIPDQLVKSQIRWIHPRDFWNE